MEKSVTPLNVLRYFVFAILILVAGNIYYKTISDTWGIEIVFVKPIIILASMFYIFIPWKTQSKYMSNLIWNCIHVVAGVSITMLILSVNNELRNNSPIKYSCMFYSEEGLYLEFRENHTFKARNEDMLSASINYGKYMQTDSIIILKDEVKFGMSKMNDTLIVTKSGIKFSLESEWRVNEGVLWWN